LKALIQEAFSSNCMAAVPLSKPLYSSRLVRKVSMAKASASGRGLLPSRSLSARIISPPTIGSQITKLSNGRLLIQLFLLVTKS
jgi:hypothetical protein